MSSRRRYASRFTNSGHHAITTTAALNPNANSSTLHQPLARPFFLSRSMLIMPFAWQVDDVIGVAMNGATWVRVSGVLIPTAGLLLHRSERKKLQVRGLRMCHCPWSCVLLHHTCAGNSHCKSLCLSIGGVCSHIIHFACDRRTRSSSGDKTGIFLHSQMLLFRAREAICKAEGAARATTARPSGARGAVPQDT